MRAATTVLGEGDTPVIALDRLARRWGLGALWAKCEHVNPTGSYKDRIAAASMALARRRGLRGWIATSSGNGGAAMAAYGRRSGLPGVLCLQRGAPPEKLASVAAYGIPLLEVSDMGPVVMDALVEVAAERRLLLTITSHRHNPEGMRGADAIGHELRAARPDLTSVYLPCGGGGLLVATARGLAAPTGTTPGTGPAVVACQPAGCAPIALAAAGRQDRPGRPLVAGCSTAVSGLQLPDPPDGEAAVAAVARSGGWGTTVTDEETWAAQDLLAHSEGLFVEPAAAVALAAVAADVRTGRLGPADRVAVVLTGSGLKDLRRYSRMAPPPVCTPAELPDRIDTVLSREET